MNYIKDPILDPYYIQLDEHCYAAQKEIIAEGSGKSYQQTIGYYNSLQSCLRAIIRDSVKQNDYTSIQEYIDRWEKLQDKFQNQFKVKII